ncbi:MAG: two-component regulator propeller domain-containing protein [Bacteroidia bacterium]|jgi:ligand-binding sensor domain-containing protein|nr:T9SS type A sorting domain-containing protein [Bacteroidia bacterium]
MKLASTILFIVCSLSAAQAQSFKSYTDLDGLPSKNVLSLASDGNGTMWFGTQKGIAIFDGNTWEVMNTTTHPGLANDNVSSILITSSGDVWIGGDYGVSKYSGSTWTTYTTSDGLGSNRITNLTEVSNGDIWISDFNGATLYDGTSFKAYKSADGLPFGGVEDIVEIKNGDILMATGLGGLALFDGTDFTLITDSEGLVSNNTTALAVDASENVWVGTSNGVSVFSEAMVWQTNHTRMYEMPMPDTLNPVEDIVVDSKGNVWTGIYVDYLVTVGGIAKFDGSTWTDYDETDGMVGPTIRALAVDENDAIWVATSSGVTKIGEEGASVKLMAKESLKVYPNPASDRLNIELTATDMDSEIRLINSQGKEIYRNESNNMSNLKIDVSSYDSGIYTLLVGNKVSRVLVL